jgi:hypothetical protein
LIVLLGLAGCIRRDDIVHVTLRDPARVSVHADGAPILDEKSEHGEVPQAAFVAYPVDGASVERHGADIEAWCDECRTSQRRSVMHASLLDLDGTAAQVLRSSNGELHARYRFADLVNGRRGWQPRFELDVVTPVDNVVSIDAESRVSPRNGTLHPTGELVFGTLGTAVGLGLLAVGIDEHEPGLDAGGIGVAVISATFAALALELAHARDHHVAIRP